MIPCGVSKVICIFRELICVQLGQSKLIMFPNWNARGTSFNFETELSITKQVLTGIFSLVRNKKSSFLTWYWIRTRLILLEKGKGLFLVEQAKLDLSQNVLVMTRMSKRNIRHNIERYSEWNTEWNIKPYLYQMGNSFQWISKILLFVNAMYNLYRINYTRTFSMRHTVCRIVSELLTISYSLYAIWPI